MSDHFITNITGVPTTGQYGPDGKPLNVNNDGGIEVTPQNAGNVPSAGTESREGADNDKSITGNPYNPNASSTDSQSIGPSSPPDQTHYANAQAHSLYKQASIGGDKTDWNLYKQDPVDVLSGDLSTYDGYWSIGSSSKITEGQSTFHPTPLSPTMPPPAKLTYFVGGMPQVRAMTAGFPQGSVSVNMARGANPTSECYKGTSDVPCEILTCADGTPVGKKMRIFEGDGCMGLNSFWMQATNPMKSPLIESQGKVYDTPLPYGYDPTDCDQFTENGWRRFRVTRIPPSWTEACWWEYVNLTRNNPNGGRVTAGYTSEAVWGHALMFVGDDLAEISDKKWCEFCNEADPRQTSYPPRNDPTRPTFPNLRYGRCYDVDGYRKIFLEGPSCTAAGRDQTEFDGKLYGCCCPTRQAPLAAIPNLECAPFGPAAQRPRIFELTQVSDGRKKVILGGEDDPCDCRYRENNGPIFDDNYDNVTGNDSSLSNKFRNNQPAFISGCTKESAEYGAAVQGDNVYIMSTGTAPSFNSGECAWMYTFNSGVRCPEVDAQATLGNNDPTALGYCPSGADILISDRYVFEDGTRFTSHTGCSGVQCTPCTSGTPLFAVGDYVTINAATQSAMSYALGSWDKSGTFDLSSSGAYVDGVYGLLSGFNVGVVNGLSGCDILSDSWKVSRREYGDGLSTPDSLDCTFGYQIEFTGCSPCSGSTSTTCRALGTGMAPNYNGPFIDWFLPETALTSGDCVDVACTPCVQEDSLFEVGDYVNLLNRPEWYAGQAESYLLVPSHPGCWGSKDFIDFTVSGSNHSSNIPFSTGCADDISLCAWEFSETGAAGPQYPGIGFWELSSSGTCCDCNASHPTSGLQGDGTYIANNNDMFSYDCNTATTGCDIYSQAWKVIGKGYGTGCPGTDGELIGCEWGYQVEFTGCPATTGLCTATGYAPLNPSITLQGYILEDWFTSGTGCS